MLDRLWQCFEQPHIYIVVQNFQNSLPLHLFQAKRQNVLLTAISALDVKELLHSYVSSKAGLRDCKIQKQQPNGPLNHFFSKYEKLHIS